MGQMEWFLIAVVFVLILGVTMILTICSMAKWLYRAVMSEVEVIFKRAAALAAEDARLANEYRELMKAFTASAVECELDGGTPEPTLLQCKAIKPDRAGMAVMFQDMPIVRTTRYRGMRILYRGKNLFVDRFGGGDQTVNNGDTLKLTYTLETNLLSRKEKPVSPDSTDPMFDGDLDLGPNSPEWFQ